MHLHDKDPKRMSHLVMTVIEKATMLLGNQDAMRVGIDDIVLRLRAEPERQTGYTDNNREGVQAEENKEEVVVVKEEE